ncbi:MAG: hypothetical protein IPG93_04610 [Burkholderiales bacterium]|nr:hypothetical protein [Burkholderiales bacterium]
MSTQVALLESTVEDVVEFAQQMSWIRINSVRGGDATWRVDMLDATLTVRRIDAQFTALLIDGADASLLLADLTQVLDLFDDVDVLNEIAAVSEPNQLVPWIARLAAFAEGPFQASTLTVLNGLLDSERFEFVDALVHGLSHACWRELEVPLVELGQRRPQIKPLTDAAVASISAAAS